MTFFPLLFMKFLLLPVRQALRIMGYIFRGNVTSFVVQQLNRTDQGELPHHVYVVCVVLVL